MQEKNHDEAEKRLMISGIDHVVILVEDLDKAIEQYENLGFVVEPGGKHPRYTHNALVAIGDGSYIELISFYELDGADAHRWFKYRASNGGLIDYAVLTDDLEAELERLNNLGIAYTGPNEGARKRPDGEEIAWKTATPSGDDTAGLPFIIEDVTHRDLRVPGGEGVGHDNGVEQLARLVIAVRDLKNAVDKHRVLFDSEPEDLDYSSSGHGVEGVAFTVGNHRIELHAPTMEGGITEELAERGEGPYELVLNGSQTAIIDPNRAGNARIRIDEL
jgi:catechol 2,3-dioxygenase-like lactoylglutathione lyase family enzyme